MTNKLGVNDAFIKSHKHRYMYNYVITVVAGSVVLEILSSRALTHLCKNGIL